MPTDHTAIPAVAQFDETSCWAAALEWWARASRRVVIDQLTLISKYEQYWDSSGDPDTNPNYGTVSRDGLMSIMSEPVWRMRCEEILRDTQLAVNSVGQNAAGSTNSR